jgi:cytochrome P450
MSIATLLSGATFYLLNNPDKMQRLCQEIRGSFQSIKDMTFDSLASLKYLNACLKESLRIYPPVPIGTSRLVPEGGLQILGRWMPAGCRVSCHHYAMYHSAANFRDPDAFVPERWLGDSRYVNDVQDVHQPFSYGPRNCLGQNMAMHEMRIIFSTVLFNFDLELCDENDDWPDQQTYAVWLKKPLKCRIRPVATSKSVE